MRIRAGVARVVGAMLQGKTAMTVKEVKAEVEAVERSLTREAMINQAEGAREPRTGWDGRAGR